MHLPDLISDLALILIVAGFTTIIFKRIRQPLVLGYIVAGFLTGPYFTVMPTVMDMENIHIWSEIGIICLMFALGLEFSFHKLANVGGTAIITAITEVFGLFLCGFLAGYLLGFSTVDCVILGGVLSMSSTTIIIKAFEELNLRGKKFTEIVFGALIVEDIAGIFLMVGMSTFAMRQNSSGGELMLTVMQLMFYLILWLILGIFAIPTLLKKVKSLMNDETLLIVSLGICFGVVLLFSYIGFSTALGSFIAGSILAGTMFAEKIEHLLKPIKDLFGAVFFISVGMLVNPEILLQYAWPIVVITVFTIIGKLVFSSLGVLLSGQKLHTAVYCGASLAQIGEFAFIIAALGMSLKLISDFIYPIVVSVSVVTTFTTPFFIKHAEQIYAFVKGAIPSKLYEKIHSHTADDQDEKEHDDYWNRFLRKYFLSILGRVIVILGILETGTYIVSPFLEKFMPDTGGQILTTAILILCMSPFLVTILRHRDKNFMVLLIKSKTNLFPLMVFMVIRVVIAVGLVALTVNKLMGISIIWLIFPALLFIIVISRSDWIIGKYFQIEARFLANFNEKALFEQEKQSGDEAHHSWLSEELWVSRYSIEPGCKYIGHALKEQKWRKMLEVDIIKIISGKKHINIPAGNQKFHAGDIIFALGTKEHIEAFNHIVATEREGIKQQNEIITLKDYIAHQDGEYGAHQLFCYGAIVNSDLYFEGKNIKESKIRTEWHCNVIGIKRGRHPIIYPDVQFVINNGDQIWLLGGHNMVGRLIMEGLVQSEEFSM